MKLRLHRRSRCRCFKSLRRKAKYTRTPEYTEEFETVDCVFLLVLTKIFHQIQWSKLEWAFEQGSAVLNKAHFKTKCICDIYILAACYVSIVSVEFVGSLLCFER